MMQLATYESRVAYISHIDGKSGGIEMSRSTEIGLFVPIHRIRQA